MCHICQGILSADLGGILYILVKFNNSLFISIAVSPVTSGHVKTMYGAPDFGTNFLTYIHLEQN